MDNLVQIFSADVSSLRVLLLMLCASFAGGLISSVSPCSIAMLPLIIGYVGGCSKETPRRTFIQLSCFIFGTALVFSIIGMVCAITGNVFASALGGYFMLIMASILLVLGLKITNILDFEIPVIIKTMPVNNTNSLFVYPVLLGVVYALIGTPCSTPFLAGIMAFAAIGKSPLAAILMLFLFALGQGVILIFAGLFTSGIKNLKRIACFTEYLTYLSGWLLVIVSLYIYYKVFAPLF